jgi:hypothetical protein
MEEQLFIDEFYTFPEDNNNFQISPLVSQDEIGNQIIYIINYLFIGFSLYQFFLNVQVQDRLIWICILFYNNMFGYRDEQNYESKKSEKEKIPEIKYEDKYKDKIAVLETVELSKEKIDELKSAIIMETTPLGNVIMYYDNSREVFTYYSDSTIPYRFLETCARKYVVLHNCKAIFVDMEEEIKNAEKKLEEKKEQKKKEEEEKETHKSLDIPLRKNVFAKLKSYNKDSGLKVAGISGDSKNAGTKKTTAENEDNMILKEKANRYSCEGKIMNFSFLKKVDRKVVDKRYGMSFAEFKKMQSGL